MYEPPHWTRPPQVKLAKREEPADTPAKPHTSPSIEDLAESIKTLKDGMRAMAEQLAGLTARVDDLAEYIRPIREPEATNEPACAVAVDTGSKDIAVAFMFHCKPDGTVVVEDVRNLDAIDTGPGGCANAIAEQEAALASPNEQEILAIARKMLRSPLYYADLFGKLPEGTKVGTRLKIRLPPADYGQIHEADMHTETVRLPNDFLTKMEEKAHACTCHPSEAPVPCQRRYALTECCAAAEKAAFNDGLHAIDKD